MVIVRLVGGLGNQLFQYSFGRAFSLRNKTPLLLDIGAFKDYKLRPYALAHFNISANSASPDQIAQTARKVPKWMFWKSPRFYREPHFEFDAKVKALRPPIYLDGYWQSEKYFSEFSEQLRSDLRIIAPVSSENIEMLAQIQEENSVSMHIRRGDYLTNPAAAQVHGVLELEYYYEAMERMRTKMLNPKFFVFSDDPVWVKKNFRDTADLSFSSNPNTNKDYEDLRLMSACKSHIIANSTFSWWGAWLNPRSDKTVIAPKNWFAANAHNDKDLIPTSWERI